MSRSIWGKVKQIEALASDGFFLLKICVDSESNIVRKGCDQVHIAGGMQQGGARGGLEGYSPSSEHGSPPVGR